MNFNFVEFKIFNLAFRAIFLEVRILNRGQLMRIKNLFRFRQINPVSLIMLFLCL